MNPNAAQATLGVTKGEVIAVSKEAARAKLQLYDVWVSVVRRDCMNFCLRCAGKTLCDLVDLWVQAERGWVYGEFGPLSRWEARSCF